MNNKKKKVIILWVLGFGQS